MGKFDVAMITGAYRSQCRPHTPLFVAGCPCFFGVMHLFLTVASAFSVLESQLCCLNLS